MSKEVENKETETINPFAGFSLLDTPKVEQPVKTDVKDESGEQEEIGASGEDTPTEKDKEAASRQAKADAELAKVAAKQAKAIDKKNGVIDEDDEEEADPEQNNEEDSADSSLKPFLEAMGERGTLIFDPKDYKEEEFQDEEIVDKVIGKTVQKYVEDWKNSYPDDTKAFLNFVEQGGDPKQFINVYYGDQSWEDYKIESEASQKAVIRESLRLADYTQEEIDDELGLYEDSGKLEAKAKSHLSKLQKYEKESKEQLVAQQSEYRKQQEAANKKYYEDLHKHWFEKEDLNGFKLNKPLKEKVWDTIYKVDRKTGKTALQESYENNVDAQFMYAMLVATNYDMSKFEKQVENKVTSKIRKTLGNYTDSRSKIQGASRTERQDKVDKDGTFDGFKRIL